MKLQRLAKAIGEFIDIIGIAGRFAGIAGRQFGVEIFGAVAADLGRILQILERCFRLAEGLEIDVVA